MKQPINFTLSSFQFVATALLVVRVTPLALAQNEPHYGGAVEDWSHHHVIFSDPGTQIDAIMHGRREQWERITNDPRYRLQQIRQSTGSAAREGANLGSSLKAEEQGVPLPIHKPLSPFPIFHPHPTLHADWSVGIEAGSPGGVVGQGVYPAKYTFAPIGAPDCTNDFVVFPVSVAGAGSQANIVGVNNLYAGTCGGSVPKVLFSYFVGTGVVQTSPVLSLDGTKVAFVESVTGGAIFHVVKLDKRGNSGCPGSPCNGAAFGSPAVPGTNNGALDTKITMAGNVHSDTLSSPFVDYLHDVAYVGDDIGNVHKFTGVFNGTPAEAGSPWPWFSGSTKGPTTNLTSPVYDAVSQNIFVGNSNGFIYCLSSAAVACPNAFIRIGTGPVFDSPIVDSTAQTVFATANNDNNAVLAQQNTALGSQIGVTMGANGDDRYDGTFDNAYFTSVSTGHMYFCGNLNGASTPTLWRVGFNSSGTMNSSRDATGFQLVVSGNTTFTVDCTPLTEIFNAAKNIDYLFLGVENHGFNTGTPNCGNLPCVMSFILPADGSFPISANATLSSTPFFGGITGIIIDNVSGANGASQIYFGNMQNGTGVQVSQSTLQ